MYNVYVHQYLITRRTGVCQWIFPPVGRNCQCFPYQGRDLDPQVLCVWNDLISRGGRNGANHDTPLLMISRCDSRGHLGHWKVGLGTMVGFFFQQQQKGFCTEMESRKIISDNGRITDGYHLS